MKTDTIKRGIFIMLLSICMSDSLWAIKRITFSPPIDNFHWLHTNIQHRFPHGFHYVEQVGWMDGATWKKNRTGEWIPRPTAMFVADVLLSSDKQCELYCPVVPNKIDSYEKDSLSYVRQSRDWFYPQPKLAHRNVILRYLSEFKGRADFRFDDYVTAIGSKIPREYFNADSVFFWDFPIEPTELDGQTYTECTFMFIWNGGSD